MQNSQSIKKLVVVFVLIACSVMVVSYSVLVNIFFEKGLGLAVQHRLELEASSYSAAYDKDHAARLPEAANFRTFEKYNDLSPDIKDVFSPSDFPIGKFIVVKPNIDDEDTFHFVYSWKRQDDVVLYFVYSLGDADRSEIIHSTAHGILYYSIATGLISLLVIILVAMLMMRRIARLVSHLVDWAFKLNKDNVEDSAQNFEYKELNQLAALYQDNMRRQMASIQREKRFLRNASHELRTPVAVLQTNLDWLNRLGVGSDEKFERPFRSMRKAVKNMKELIATLLWVEKKDVSSVPRHEVCVDKDLLGIIEENSYLLADKDVHVRKDIHAQSMLVPEILGRIIWSNIIRNAFQHSYEGDVEISLLDGVLIVKNAIASNAGEDSSDSFGLGLMLIQELIESIGWKLVLEEGADSYSAILYMHSLK
ncbi:sensor histidine kinase [Maridesulfovibrio zosterae]|uniref:sensor histidine kinase n=1 Tax=Maridesulfovibrio zosterae TaxID=82171 RepID=UPI00042114AF|nr:HAMP domain-containing sensor histidine kinase [Maridesulfovibrio zosterae]